MGGAAPTPLTLRDLLELACESASSDGFRSYPRRLPATCELDPAAGALVVADDVLRRSPSRSLSSIFSPRSPRSLANISRLTRSFSRRLREGFFWRGREDDDERDSLGLPSPVVSSCSASECAESEADSMLATEEEKSDKTSPSSSSSTGSLVDAAGAGAVEEQKGIGGGGGGEPVERSLGMMEDKQQLSPVSVMDFPFDDDGEEERSDAGTCSPSFQQRIADLERSKTQQRKIRRLDGLAQAVGPVDLDARFTASSSGRSDDTDTHGRSSSSATAVDHGDGAATTPRSDEHESVVGQEDQREPDDEQHRLLALLLNDDTAADSVVAIDDERLLHDFFAEGVDRLRAASAGPVVGTARHPLDDHGESALVRAAREWVQGAGPQWGLGEVLFAGEAALADMERGRRWMCVGEEERDVGEAVEGLVMDALLAELVCDLAAPRVCTDLYVCATGVTSVRSLLC